MVIHAGTSVILNNINLFYEMKFTDWDNLEFSSNNYYYGDVIDINDEIKDTFKSTTSHHLGMSYSHISNASLGNKNPGANSYMFNFLKQF